MKQSADPGLAVPLALPSLACTTESCADLYTATGRSVRRCSRALLYKYLRALAGSVLCSVLSAGRSELALYTCAGLICSVVWVKRTIAACKVTWCG